MARELTKKFEECRSRARSPSLPRTTPTHPPKGEIVLLVGPPVAPTADADRHRCACCSTELETEKPSQAAAQGRQAATGLDRKVLYARALELK